MVFSSLNFLFLFFPALLMCYFALPSQFRAGRNLILLAFSLFFYAYAGGRYFPVMLLSIALNYVFGLLCAPERGALRRGAAALSNRYIGSKSREVYDLWPHEERLSIGEVTENIPFRRWDNGAETAASLYTLPESEEEAVFYTAYMGGDIAETVIRTDRSELPNALIVGESFTNPVETLLWASFNETRSLDLRHYSEKSLEAYIEEYRPDVVICLRDDTVFLTDLE